VPGVPGVPGVPMMRRAINILHKFGEATGYEHPHVRPATENSHALLQAMNLSQPEIQAKAREVLRPDTSSA
jgi:hypothetical protein